jgi:hypothetical protein
MYVSAKHAAPISQIISVPEKKSYNIGFRPIKTNVGAMTFGQIENL